MATPRNLEERIGSHKRRYKRTITDMITVLQGELKHLDDDIFEPSSSIDSTAFHLIQECNRLKALLEVEETDQ